MPSCCGRHSARWAFLQVWARVLRQHCGGTLESCAAYRGFTCLDWTEIKHRYPNSKIVTVPIEASEGVLGALTGAAGPEKPDQDLTIEMQALAKGLAHSLTFCKCKSDLQVRNTLRMARPLYAGTTSQV